MATPASYYVKLGFTRATSTSLVEKGRNNVTMLTGNATYPTPVPALTLITNACNKLDAANQAYQFNRGKLEKEARDVAFVELKELLKELGGYVQTTSQGDKDKILSAGFDVRKRPFPVGQLQAPQNVRALVTPYAGRLDVRWDGVRGRNMYELSYTAGDPNLSTGWSLLALTSKNRFTAEGLTSNTVYSFRVVAIGAAGASPVSDAASAKAA